MQLGLILCAGSCIVAGPSQILGLAPLLWLMFLGQFLLGFFAAFLFIPVTPEIIEAIQLSVKECEIKKGVEQNLLPEEVEANIAKKLKAIGGQLADKASAC